jgi:hypothetical protein
MDGAVNWVEGVGSMRLVFEMMRHFGFALEVCGFCDRLLNQFDFNTRFWL